MDRKNARRIRERTRGKKSTSPNQSQNRVFSIIGEQTDEKKGEGEIFAAVIVTAIKVFYVGESPEKPFKKYYAKNDFLNSNSSLIFLFT